jgi:uncharacterized membrane protein YraQ (UPF0718 family)
MGSQRGKQRETTTMEIMRAFRSRARKKLDFVDRHYALPRRRTTRSLIFIIVAIIVLHNFPPAWRVIDYRSSLFLQILVGLVVNEIVAVAKQEKIIKKPLNLKPVKNAKDAVLDEFQQHLAPEDADFIKQIDKQFKEHGDKLKIKFERENSTKPMNKNTKRTIDDSLG